MGKARPNKRFNRTRNYDASQWDNKVGPPFNFNKEQSLASIERIVKLVAKHKAQLWIGHDKDITAKIDRAPKFYE